MEVCRSKMVSIFYLRLVIRLISRLKFNVIVLFDKF